MKDFSFIRLKPDLNSAITESLPYIAELPYFDQIQLHPKETYLQITNTESGIAFNGNYNVTICDKYGIELLDITEKVAIFEFIDNKGVNQIAFELAFINNDFYKKEVLLKFKHTVSDYVWFSNLLIISEYKIQNTTRFDYKCFNNFNGIAYNRAPYFQSIRLKCNYLKNDSESISNQYTSIDGVKVTSRLIETEFENYNFEGINTFTYRRLNKLLSNQVIYINGNRITDKQTIASDDILGLTNIFDIKFKVSINYSDTFKYSLQIFEPLKVNFKAPFPAYTLLSLPNDIFILFNRNVQEVNGTIQLIDNSDNSILHTFTPATITTISNTVSATFVGDITTNGSYKVKVSQGLFYSILGEYNDTIEWDFIVNDGDFNSPDFSSTDFNTN